MPLLSDNLTVWEIGFRWAGLEPDQRWLRIPLLVRDNFRNLMDAILQGHLYSDTLALEKWDPSKDEVPEGYIRHWLDDVYACIEGRAFNRKLLRWAGIDRWAMQLWCDRHGIPLPEFWFPPGWGLEYKWPEEATGEEAVHDTEPASAESERPPESGRTSDASPAGAQEGASGAAQEAQLRGTRALDRRQRGRIACEEVAKRYWIRHPGALVKEVAGSHEVQEIAPGSDFQLEVVQRWLGEVDTRDPTNRRGPKRRKI